RNCGELHVALDDGAGLVAIEPRHQDVAENQLRLMVIDLGQRVKTVFRQHHLVAALLEKNFGAAPNGVAVVDDQNPETRSGRAHWRLLLKIVSPTTVVDSSASDVSRSGPFRSLPSSPRT